MFDILMVYFAGGFLMCSLLLIAQIHDLRKGLHCSKTDFIVCPIAFLLSWGCLLLALYYYITRREDL